MKSVFPVARFNVASNTLASERHKTPPGNINGVICKCCRGLHLQIRPSRVILWAKKRGRCRLYRPGPVKRSSFNLVIFNRCAGPIANTRGLHPVSMPPLDATLPFWSKRRGQANPIQGTITHDFIDECGDALGCIVLALRGQYSSLAADHVQASRLNREVEFPTSELVVRKGVLALALRSAPLPTLTPLSTFQESSDLINLRRAWLTNGSGVAELEPCYGLSWLEI